MNEIAAIIRLCYVPGYDEAEIEWRFKFFHEQVLPRLKGMDVWVWTHPRHDAKVIGAEVFHVDLDPRPSIAFENTGLRGYPWSSVQGLPKYPYQVLLGSDDLLGPQFVKQSLDHLKGMWRGIASHQPLMLEINSGRCFETRWLPRPSPLLMLKQPFGEQYTWVWAEDHRKLGKFIDNKVAYVPQGQAVMVIHRYNDGTRITAKMKEVERPAWL